MGIFKQAYLNDKDEMLPYFMWLSSLGDIGIKTYVKMQSRFASPKDVFLAGYDKLTDSKVFTEKQKQNIIASRKTYDVSGNYENMIKSGIKLIVRESSEFPERLKEIPGSPISLFTYGKLPKPGIPLAAIIGARECSFYGMQVAARLGEVMADNGICVVSGMARGIDSISQEACLKAGGTSIAVLGGGVDVLYPKESEKLYEELKERGAIISEYPPGTMPQRSYFAQRNRLISGISDTLCVIEAREKSGTMITVDSALEQGREVYALPGRITDGTSRGCNELIKQGAGVITDVESLASEIANIYSRPRMDSEYEKIYRGETQNDNSDKNDANHTSNINDAYMNNHYINIEETCSDYELDAYIEKMSEEDRKIFITLDEDSFTSEQAGNMLGINPSEFMVKCMKLSIDGMFVNMGAGRFRMNEKGLKVKRKLLQI